ncbi:MAG: GNAT family N-acetyltransferase [Candidatus Peregrinibacteria bacterium]|nr:GNAT family N-acetyltransferase [Candidatus Peregrinibacteria bacterium]
MLRTFGPADQETILSYAYKSERENLFVIGSFNREDAEGENTHVGFFEGKEMRGLGTYFGRFGSLVINAESPDVTHALVDHFVSLSVKIEHVPAFKCHASPTIERLESHGIKPKSISEQSVLILTHERFKDHGSRDVTEATPEDVDAIIRLTRATEGEDPGVPIIDRDRSQIFTEYEMLLRIDGEIVAKACIHGYSDHYAQIGGVVTHPKFQRKGYAKQTVSAVCKRWLSQGRHMLLFCANDNAPALKVYRTLGFLPDDAFVIAEYTS